MRWLLGLWLAVAPACAQEPIIGSGVYAPKSTAATYTGPGDIVSSATYWHGLRAYSAAVASAATQKAVNIRNTGSSETCDILVATNGGLATTVSNCSGASSGTAVSTFCGSCTATKMYDQTGGGTDINNTTAAQQPSFTLSCLGSLPCLTYTAATHVLFGSASSVNQQDTVSIVYNDTSNTNNVIWSGFTAIGTGQNTSRASANVFDIFASSHVTAPSSDNAWHAAQAVFNSSSSTINIDNTRSTVNPGTQATATCALWGANGSSGTCGAFLSNGFGGNISEAGLWPAGFSTTQQTNMCHNQFTYWGTSTSC